MHFYLEKIEGKSAGSTYGLKYFLTGFFFPRAHLLQSQIKLTVDNSDLARISLMKYFKYTIIIVQGRS